ncbi:MAG: transporter substrate-binding domain-containing protein [Bacillaceae bacterium]|nr:transporter substrate-binding domain-containing protein [Bacillaceae bacterium]
MRKSWLAILSLVLLLSVFTAGCGTSEEPSGSGGEKETFSFAMSGLYKPFNFKEDGELVGFDVEIGTEIAKRMGMEPDPVTNPWESIIPGLTTNKYDAIIGSMAITEERLEKVNFSRPYYRSGAQIFVSADNDEIKSADDLKGKVIGVVKASTFKDVAMEYTDQVKEYDSDLTALNDLPSGRIDAVITDQMVGLRMIKEGAVDIKDVGEPLWVDEMGIAVRKEDEALLENINKALESMIEDGTYEEISKKWFGRSILGEEYAK